MLFQKVIDIHKEKIDAQSILILNENKTSFMKAGSFGKDILDQIEKRITIGKSIRGSLLVFSSQMYGSELTSDIYKCSSALELIHLGVLVHDDILDQDDYRRGISTIHHHYAKKLDEKTSESLAICVGDILFFLGLNIISQTKLEPEVKNDLIDRFSAHLMYIFIAQMDDMYFSTVDKAITKKDILRLYEYKTAYYTFTLPLVSGAIVSDRKNELSKLESLGKSLGLLFQIQDDYLDLFGDEKQLGKPVGSDISENKKTIIYALVFQRAKLKDKTYLKKQFGNKRISKKDIARVKVIIHSYDIEKYLQSLMKKLADDSIVLIESLRISKQNKNILISLVEYLLTRKK